MNVADLSDAKKTLLATGGHILALGGPGSGKTYIALLKANNELSGGTLRSGQRILFLSFARATIARVLEQSNALISPRTRSLLEINTYHGFCWQLLRSHGYLLRGGAQIKLLPPPEAAARLADIKAESRVSEQIRIFQEEGLLHFDLFASLANSLLSRSTALTKIVCDTYPTIILDEFQDTNDDEWALIKTLGARSRLIALADAEQRIYEFRGADPKRIGEFLSTFSPSHFDFGTENNRSNGTDIAQFGNDLLTGANKGKVYKHVTIVKYPFRPGTDVHLQVKLNAISSIKRLKVLGQNWSLAILVPSKQLMLDVSDFLGSEQSYQGNKRIPAIGHEVALETSGPSLAAVCIAGLLEEHSTITERAHRLIRDLCSHIRGRNGSKQAAKADLELASALTSYTTSGTIRGSKRKAIVDECLRIAEGRKAMVLTGDPVRDWKSVRYLLETSSAEPVACIGNDSRFLRLMHKGALLQSKLSELWRNDRCYSRASALVREALLQEHFSTSTRDWKGVHVMTIHKSKGKEFDEVIIYEGSYHGKILPGNADSKRTAQAQLMLRVGVTRARQRTTILTPQKDVCIFL